MRRLSLGLFLLSCVLLAAKEHIVQAAAPLAEEPTYTADGQLQYPERYREWIFLTSGVDMSYNTKAAPPEHTVFDNVFVNPSSYKAFLATGTWPNGTMMVLENRAGESARSINKQGRTQAVQVTGTEIHVKDTTSPGRNLPGGWAFYSFDNNVSAKLIARPASCYTCHEQHAAVDTTFVQFYPTLIRLAETKGTLSAAYRKETAAPAN